MEPLLGLTVIVGIAAVLALLPMGIHWFLRRQLLHRSREGEVRLFLLGRLIVNTSLRSVWLVSALVVLAIQIAFVGLLTKASSPDAETSRSYSTSQVDDALGTLSWGNAAFDTPTRMRFGESKQVRLVLSPTLSISQLQEQLQYRGEVDSARIRISNRMEATLHGGSEFKVEALSEELQGVSGLEPTRWSWNVTPIEPGRQNLHLELCARIEVNARETPVRIKTFEREIQVEITVARRIGRHFEQHWQWWGSAILVPAAAFFLKKRLDKKEPGTSVNNSASKFQHKKPAGRKRRHH